MRWKRLPLVLASTAVLLAGCGGEPKTDQEQIRSGILGFWRAVGEQNWAAACAHLSDGATDGYCPAALRDFAERSFPHLDKALPALDKGEMTVRGIKLDDRRRDVDATADLVVFGVTDRHTLVQAEGEWKISGYGWPLRD